MILTCDRKTEGSRTRLPQLRRIVKLFELKGHRSLVPDTSVPEGQNLKARSVYCVEGSD